jgi:hypothetical protein
MARILPRQRGIGQYIQNVSCVLQGKVCMTSVIEGFSADPQE